MRQDIMIDVSRDYDGWNIQKKQIEQTARQQIINTGQVWWCSVGVNIGHEEDGKNSLFERPVLIFRKYGPETFLGLPLSTSYKSGIFYADIKLKGKTSSVLLSQARILSKYRLIRNMGRISITEMRSIKQSYFELFTN
jgi:mRNA-degrading endonuclease toxin of MazEF toxin-antitoxin module